MPNFDVQAVLAAATAIPADAVTNHWSFQADTVGDLEDVDGALRQFYEDIQTALANTLSGSLVLKFYDRADPSPRVPVLTTTGSLTISSAEALPSQVALVMSFQGVPFSGLPQARRRNRVFLGPWSETVNTTGGRPTAGLVSTIATAGDTLLETSLASSVMTWQAWSETSGTGTPVDSGWVDNRWDTQRRRLPRATSRTTFES